MRDGTGGGDDPCTNQAFRVFSQCVMSSILSLGGWVYFTNENPLVVVEHVLSPHLTPLEGCVQVDTRHSLLFHAPSVECLEVMKEFFLSRYAPQLLQDEFLDLSGLDDQVSQLLNRQSFRPSTLQKPRSFKESKKYQKTLQSTLDTSITKTDVQPLESARDKLVQRGIGPRGKPVKSLKEPAKEPQKEAPKKKNMRSWDAFGSPAEKRKLDYADESAPADSTTHVSETLLGSSLGTRSTEGIYDALEMEDMRVVESKQASKGGFLSFISSFTAPKSLSRADLDPILSKMREHLILKNVAADISTTLCERIGDSLIGQEHGPFTSLEGRIRIALEESLGRILTPKTSIDLLRDIFAARDQARPFTMAFIGVNGVGTSTLQKFIPRKINQPLQSLFLALAKQSQGPHCRLRHL